MGVGVTPKPVINRRSKPAVGFVYFVRAPSSERIKIGITNNVARRLADMQTGSGDRLEVIGFFGSAEPGRVEKVLHWKFELARVHGEWFRATPGLLEFIGARAFGPSWIGTERPLSPGHLITAAAIRHDHAPFIPSLGEDAEQKWREMRAPLTWLCRGEPARPAAVKRKQDAA